MTIINPGGPHKYTGGGYQVRSTWRSRVGGIIGGVLALAAVALFFAAPVLIVLLIAAAIPIGLAVRAYNRNRGSRGALYAFLWIGSGVLAFALMASNDGGPLFGGIIGAVFSLFSGAAAGWQALGLLPHIFEVAPFTEPVLFGVASGALVGALRNWRRWRISKPATDSLVSSSLSGDRWARSWLTIETFAISLIAAYLTAVLLEMLGIFDTVGADPVHAALAIWNVIGGGSGSGGTGDASPLFALIIAILLLIAAITGFGFVAGLCSGAPLGAVSGFLSWHRMLHSTAATVTRDLITRSRGTRGSWVFAAILRGCSEGVLSGVIAGVLLAALHVLRVC